MLQKDRVLKEHSTREKFIQINIRNDERGKKANVVVHVVISTCGHSRAKNMIMNKKYKNMLKYEGTITIYHLSVFSLCACKLPDVASLHNPKLHRRIIRTQSVHAVDDL